MLRCLAVVAMLLTGGPLHAAESRAAHSARATVTLVSDTDAAAPNQPLRVALRIRLAPGWHTYWRNPGDAGVPPAFPLTLSPGTTAGPVAWPVPQRVAEGPVNTYAYTADTLLPVTLVPAGGALHVATHATWLVCNAICVPEEADLALDLPQGTPSPSAEAPLFDAAASDIPRPSPFETTLAPDATLVVRAPGLLDGVTDAWFLPDVAGEVDSGDQPFRRVPGGFALSLSVPKPPLVLGGVVVMQDRSGQRSAFDIRTRPGPAPASGPGLARAILFALAGGLLLNLMPCVFPVLALKAFSVLRAPDTRAVRRNALAYVAGVLATFAALGAVLLFVRGALGWGFQFQSPAIVAAMACVVLATGLSLSGVFHVSAGRLASAGAGGASQDGLAGSFLTGLLAVLVATPCTAPFMGAALTAALAAPPATGLAIFLALGAGLAAPYAVLAAAPGAARLLPRPGRWMARVKHALAVPMYATAAWLLWIVSRETDTGMLAAALAMALTAAACVAWSADRRAPAGAALAAALLAVALVAPARAPAADTAETYSPQRLAALRDARRPVFVNLTADWCVTCLVNERVALAPAPVQRAFADHDVAYLKGDWTRQDPAVTSLLRENDRVGVPLYLFYRPGAREPEILPQILTQRAVLDIVGG